MFTSRILTPTKILPDNLSVCGPDLKGVIESELNMLGRSTIEVILEEMQTHSFNFEENHYYTSEQVHIFFYNMFGRDGASLLMQKIAKAFAKRNK